ncbi:MAG: type II toxin-antitoxin system RelE/ParE family toxin [Patescibacteria group bacterium]
MSFWTVRLKKGAEEDLNSLDKPIRRRVLEKLFWLEGNFDDILPRSLSNKLSRYYKLRVGDWRVVYIVKEETREVSVIAIDHRKDIYGRMYELESN